MNDTIRTIGEVSDLVVMAALAVGVLVHTWRSGNRAHTEAELAEAQEGDWR